ncbi:MAG: DNA-binding response regulator [Rhodobacteraceae bacterium]|nr:DNA-binding response regulator [Paracoccaceae bacterium]MAY47225.1 DNA-binding response regulator [Paracoccaceae bacterium]QEW22335.1 Protease production enhancer protein [Marinibacterium anthonyi]
MSSGGSETVEGATPGGPHSVLIVEDQEHTASRFARAVDASPELTVCGIARDLAHAWALFESRRPRFVLTDLGLPDGSGVEIILAAAKAEWACDCMVISVFGDRRRAMEAIRAGARGYLLKSDPVDEVARQILEVIGGGSPMNPKIARYLLDVMGPADNDAALPDQERLTQREHEVLSLVARGYKRREIADLLNISVGTVGIHINNTYKKLKVGTNIEAVARASKIGLL